MPGISEQVYTTEELNKLNEKVIEYNGREYTRYEADQYQRSLERTIRKYKRRYILSEGVGDQKESERNQSFIRKWSNELDRFTRATGLKRDYERERETVGKDKDASEQKNNYDKLAMSVDRQEIKSSWEAPSRNVSKEEKVKIIEYAKERQINIVDLSKFDGDIDLLKSEIDTLSDLNKKFPLRRNDPLTITISDTLEDDDFAQTKNHVITFNQKALRDRLETEKNIEKAGIFASIKAEDIVIHEYGHILAKNYGTNGIERAKKAYYTVFGDRLSSDEIMLYLLDNVSPYCRHYNGDYNDAVLRGVVREKKFTEITSEILVLHLRNPNEFTQKYLLDLLGG